MKTEETVDNTVEETEELKTQDEATVDESIEAATEELEEMVETIEESLKKEISELEDQYLRAQAEIVNMRNRHIKEREEAAKYRAQDLAKELIPALDNLDRALSIEVSDEHGESMKKGIEMVRESMIHAFKESGISEIKAEGQRFDPNLHQAIQLVPAQEGQESDEIVQVLQKGYQLHDRILRPSMVIVTQ